MTTVREFELGETVEIYVEVKNQLGTLVDPATSIKVTIYKPDGTEALAATSMTKVDTGKYNYYYTSVVATPPAADPLGWYRVRITVMDIDKVTIKDGGFNVK